MNQAKREVPIILRIENLKTEIRTSRGVICPVEIERLDIGAGQAVGLVGESGSGKSMTAFSLLKLFPSRQAKIAAGEIWLGDSNLLQLNETEMRGIRGNRVGMIFQDPSLYLNPVITVGEQLEEQLAAHHLEEGAPKKIARVLEEVGLLPEIASRYTHELSGGMQQRVGIASALICDPELIIADEPTTALDVTIQAQILRLLARIQEERQVSLLLITHDLGIVAELCQEVYIMYVGKIIEHGQVFAIFEDPKHPYTQGLLRGALSVQTPQEITVPMEGSIPDFIDLPSGCRFHPRCSYVMDICRKKDPPFIESDSGFAACWSLTAHKEGRQLGQV